MDPGSIAVLTALVGVVIGLIELLKHFVTKKKQNGNGHLTPDQAGQLLSVAKFCTQFEVRWDFMKENIKDLRDQASDNSASVGKLVASQDRVTERLIELINKMDRVLERRMD